MSIAPPWSMNTADRAIETGGRSATMRTECSSISPTSALAKTAWSSDITPGDRAQRSKPMAPCRTSHTCSTRRCQRLHDSADFELLVGHPTLKALPPTSRVRESGTKTASGFIAFLMRTYRTLLTSPMRRLKTLRTTAKVTFGLAPAADGLRSTRITHQGGGRHRMQSPVTIYKLLLGPWTSLKLRAYGAMPWNGSRNMPAMKCRIPTWARDVIIRTASVMTRGV